MVGNIYLCITTYCKYQERVLIAHIPSPQEYKQGKTLFCFELAPDVIQDYGILNRKNEGPFRLDLKFKSNITSNLTLVLWMEFDTKLKVNNNRTFTSDYLDK
jgi:hypothetical protein